MLQDLLIIMWQLCCVYQTPCKLIYSTFPSPSTSYMFSLQTRGLCAFRYRFTCVGASLRAYLSYCWLCGGCGSVGCSAILLDSAVCGAVRSGWIGAAAAALLSGLTHRAWTLVGAAGLGLRVRVCRLRRKVLL